jgi:Choline dehydrogenase and related flavoproteins
MYLSEASQIDLPSPRTVIIGAGTVGLYLASLLVSRGHNVIVIESGDRQLGQFDPESYRSIGRNHFGISQGRSRNLGGTSSLWGGQLVEFLPADFKKRTGVAGSGWPIAYEEIAPYYGPTYVNLGIPASVINDDDVLKSLGSRKPNLGSNLEMFLTRWMRTPNFAQLFADQIESNRKLVVLAGHTAVAFRGTGDRISAVRICAGDNRRTWIEGDTFVLSAGTIENARLLLTAAQDPEWPAPWSSNRNLGLYFQDHLGIRLGTFHPTNRKEFFSLFANIVHGKYKFQPKIRIRSDVLELRQTFNMQGILSFDSDASEHILFLKQFLRAALYSGKLTGLGDVLRKGTGVARFLFPLMWKYIRDHRVFVPTTAKTTLGLQGEQAPIADSRLTIDNSVKDVNGLPRVVLDWRVKGDELEPIRAFALHVGKSMSDSGFGELKIDERLLSMDPAFLDDAGDTYHQAGGAIMGISEESGVVDINLRVFSTSNFYVAGASVFPTSSGANVTFTALAFTTRLADHLTGVSSLFSN